MDNAILIAVVSELRRAITGAEVGDVVQIDSRRFAMRFSTPPFHRLAVSLHADLPSLHLVQRAPTPKEPTELAVALTERLAGTRLATVFKEACERTVELEFEGTEGRRGFLILELMGRASNLLLLDGERRVSGFLRSHRGEFRQPREGAAYEAPRPRGGEAGSPPLGSPLLAHEVEVRASRGVPREQAREDLLARMEREDWEPCLYAPGKPEDLGESEPLSARNCFPAPFPLEAGRDLACTRFESANEAAAAWAGILHRHLLFRRMKGTLSSLLRSETQRAARLVRTLEEEAEAARGAEETRRSAESLLASLTSARKEGDKVEITDYFDPATPRIRIRIDPRLDLKGNAEALFRRARKMERAAVAVSARLTETRQRLQVLRNLYARAETALSTPDLEEVEQDLNRSTVVRRVRRPERHELGRKPSFMKVRELRTSDRHVVLVGKSGADNDTLTFRIAAPHDFWFHAAGRAGAHVIVRNPRRLRELPEPALTEAAAIAAWFSRGGKAGEIDVHYTRRKDVRKGKGMSPGAVMLRSYRTVRVRPALPDGEAGD